MEQEPGPFDRVLQPEPEPLQRDRAATVIIGLVIGLGLLLLVLVFGPFGVFDSNDSGAGTASASLRDDLPAPPPEGFEAVSALYDLSARAAGQQPDLTLSLSTTVNEGETLAFFAYRDGEWVLLGEATAVAEGTAARGRLSALPDVMAVFRPTGAPVDEPQARAIAGVLPPDTQPDPRAIPMLSMLYISGFAPAADGGVAGGPFQPPEEAGVPTAPLIAAPDGAAVDAVNQILASPDLLAAHVDALLQFVADANAAGLALDYRGIDRAHGGAFVELVTQLSSALRGDSRELVLTLPLPVQSAEGWDTFGFNWEELEPLVDTITLAPVAEPDQYHARTEVALGYIVPRVGASKLRLSVGPMSHERGVDGVRELTLTEALGLASALSVQPEQPVAPDATVQAVGTNLEPGSGASGLYWDDAAHAVAFRYTGPGGERTVWLSNTFSEGFKLDLARDYQLGGVTVQDVSIRTGDANIWSVVGLYAESGTVELVRPNGSLLEPQWTASGGVLESDGGPAVAWQAPPEPGTYTLTLVVSDGITRVGQQIEVSVQPPGAAR